MKKKEICQSVVPWPRKALEQTTYNNNQVAVHGFLEKIKKTTKYLCQIKVKQKNIVGQLASL